MMTPEWKACLTAVHQASELAVLVVTGGGVNALSQLFQVPGASRTVLDAQIPYAAVALNEWLGRPPEQACSEQTALAMASVAYRRGQHLAAMMGVEAPLVGLACTAALASDRPKRGQHRAYVATQTATATTSARLTLEKGLRDRPAEDLLTSELVLRLLAEANGVTTAPQFSGGTGDVLEQEQFRAPPLLAELWSGQRACIWALPDGSLSEKTADPVRGILSGSFNPLHTGHQRLREVAEQKSGVPFVFEMTVSNADKPPLDFLTIDRRQRQFSRQPLLLTNAKTFVEKARIFPGSWFVVGVDTAERILQSRFYGGDEAATKAVLAELRALGCRFLVGGRVVEGKFENLDVTALPLEFRNLFVPLSESEFREDISSTEIRRQAREQH